MQIPTQEDWEGYENDFDAKSAYQVFFGKTNDQMQSAFRESVLGRISELRFMPDKAFQYYILGLAQYVQSGNFGRWDAPDAAAGLLDLIEQTLQTRPSRISPSMPALLPIAAEVAEDQDKFGASVDIYGSFAERLSSIQALTQRL